MFVDVEKRFTRQGARDLTIILKLSERCNLACTYCYFFFGGDESYKKHPPLIDSATGAHVGQFLARSAAAHDLSRLQVVLHGGEPLLMRPERFQELVRSLKRDVPDGCEVDVAVQTNAVLVDERWINVFSQENVSVGVSLDGPKSINDRFRLDKKGHGSFDRTIAGWRRLQRAAELGLIKHPGILSVIGDHTTGSTLRFFVEDLGVTNIDFLLPDQTYDDEGVSEVLVAHIGDVMVELFDEWTSLARPDVRVRFLNNALLPMIAEVPHGSWYHRREDLWAAMTISSDGRIFVEDTLRGIFADQAESAPYASEVSLSDVLGGWQWKIVSDAAERRPDACAACRYEDICQGGPMVSRHSKERGFDNPSVYCRALYKFHSHVERQVAATGRLRKTFKRSLVSRDGASAQRETGIS